MATIKIPRLGEKKEVQTKVTFPKRVHDLLIKYSEAYEATYGEKPNRKSLCRLSSRIFKERSRLKKYLSKNTQKDDSQSPDGKKETKQKSVTA